MKIIRTILIIFGILLFLAGLGLTFLTMMGPSGSDLMCKYAERDKKYADERLQSYEAAKAKGTVKGFDLDELEMQSKEATRTADRMQIKCDEEKSSSSFRSVISVFVLGLGILLSIIGFFIGRNKAVP